MRHLSLSLSLALMAVAVSLVQAGSSSAQQSGIFRISLSPASGLDHIDPALSFTTPGWTLLDTVCARLMAYPDRPAPAGYRLQREVAAGVRVSDGFKRYTFTLRRAFRFSDGSPVRAAAFAHAIHRLLAPAARSPGAVYARDIVGAAEVIAGRRSTAAGVVARGYKLTVRFTRPAPDFLTRTTMPFFCAVPPGLPSTPKVSERSAPPGRTSSRSTGRASASSSGATPTTVEHGARAWTASTSTSGAAPRRT